MYERPRRQIFCVEYLCRTCSECTTFQGTATEAAPDNIPACKCGGRSWEPMPIGQQNGSVGIDYAPTKDDFEHSLTADAPKEAPEVTQWGDEVVVADTGAKRANGNKIRYSLLPVVAMRDTAQIWTFGAEKYGERNWEKGFDWSGPYDCLKRHLEAWFAGEDFDSESGLSHLAHAACNLQMLQHFEYHHQQGDDRPTESMPPIRKAGPTTKTIADEDDSPSSW